MLLLESGLADWNIEILGTDLSTQILERAAAGSYLQIEINRGLPAPLLVKYFQRSGLGWLVKSEVRKFVRFTQFDLRNDMRSLGAFDLLLCRNVLIYFDIETRKKILSGIRGVLHPGGYFLMGSSETTFNLDDNFVLEHLRRHDGVPGSCTWGVQMTATLPNESYRPGIWKSPKPFFPPCWNVRSAQSTGRRVTSVTN